jgi:hypothetical protein
MFYVLVWFTSTPDLASVVEWLALAVDLKQEGVLRIDPDALAIGVRGQKAGDLVQNVARPIDHKRLRRLEAAPVVDADAVSRHDRPSGPLERPRS